MPMASNRRLGRLTSNGVNNPRGWEALEEKLKSWGMSIAEIQEVRKSFYDGIEVLSKMFLFCYDTEKKGLDK